VVADTTWEIKAKKPGSPTITMIYKRPWENDDQAKIKFQVKIVIKKNSTWQATGHSVTALASQRGGRYDD